MNPYFVISGGEEVRFSLPERWKVIQNVMEGEEKPVFPIKELVKKSIQNPIGSGRLQDKLIPSSRVAILIDDLTRPTPKKQILLPLLEIIHRRGIHKEDISIIVAIGTHHKLSKEVLRNTLGEIYEQYLVVNHDAFAEDLIPIGKLSSGSEIKINPLVAKADIRIGVGSILPHGMNGFSGGGKIIMPGVCDIASIREHHLYNMIKPGSTAGKTEGNPFWEDVCQVAKMAKLNFIINAIYNLRQEVVEIVSGDFIEAFKVGTELGKRYYGTWYKDTADLTITTTFPHDEGPQIIKPLGSAAKMTRKGGTVVMVTKLREKLPSHFLEAFSYVRNQNKGQPELFVLKLLKEKRPILEKAPVDFNMGLSFSFLYMSQVKVIIVSKDVSKTEAEEMGFSHFSSIADAIMVEEKKNPSITVNILPFGGMILPIYKGNTIINDGISHFLNEITIG
jgi:nickel-dependent lactate racemase